MSIDDKPIDSPPRINTMPGQRLFFLIAFVLFSVLQTTAFAGELYKWKDENGVVHYSEKKPEHLQKVEALEIENAGQFKPAELLPGIKRPTDVDGRHIVLLINEDFWSLNDPQKKIATYYFGGDCVSPTTASFQKIKDLHPQLFPRANDLAYEMENTIYKLNYSVSKSRVRPLKNNIARYDNALLLKWQLQNVDYHLCLFNLQKYNKNKRIRMGFDPFKYSPGDFNRRRATLTINWTLEDGLSGNVLYQTQTSGSADFWDRNNHKFKLKAVKTALQNATSNLFAQPEFFAKVTQLPSVKSRVAVKLKKLDTGLFESLANTLSSNAKNKAEFARVISSIQPLKAMIAEYYMMNDSWPKQLEDLRISNSQLIDPSYIKRVELDYNGTILIWLDEKRFAKDAAILIKPDIGAGNFRINWQCKTNLSDNYYDDYCESI